MKTPVLLLHGALGSMNQLQALADALTPTRRTLTLNFPGHGGAPSGGPFSIPSFAESVLDLLKAENLPQVDIFGYSMGGYVGLWLARNHPERVRKIVTLGTKFDWTPESAARETAMLDPEKIAAKVPQFAQALAERHAPADWKQVLQQTSGLLAGLGAGDALKDPDFQAITHPVSICRGALDQMVGREESEHVAGLLPNGILSILPDTKHPLEAADTGLLAGHILGFFDR